MQRLQKNIILILILAIIEIILMSKNVYAAGIGMSINKSTAYVGDTFTVTISGIYGKVNISGSSNISLSISGSQFVETGTLTITCTAKSTGTGIITVTPVDAVTTGTNPEEVTSVASRSITISKKPTTTTTTKSNTTTAKSSSNATTSSSSTKTTTNTTTQKEEKKTDDFYITKLVLKGVKENGEKVDIELSPKFSKKVYEYTCIVPSDIQKLELEKDAGDYTKYIKVDGLDKLKEGENTVTVKLEATGQTSRKYMIKVTKEAETIETNIEPEETEQTEDEQVIEKDQIMVTMPLGAFIALEAGIMVIEALIICLIPWKKIFKRDKH